MRGFSVKGQSIRVSILAFATQFVILSEAPSVILSNAKDLPRVTLKPH